MTPRFEVQSFEQIPAGPDTVLLRIAGRWLAPTRERLPTPLLLLDDGRRIHRLAPLPGPDDAAPQAGPEGPVWRAAFSAPADVVGGARIAYALQTGAGQIADLPRPTRRGGPPPPAAPPPVLAPPPAAPASAASPAAARGLTGPLRRRGRAPETPPSTLDVGELARASDLSALHARLAEERAARENAERRATEAHSIAQQTAAEAARAAEIAHRAEAARAGAVDALTEERIRASERAVAEEERAREHRERAARAAEQARQAVAVAHEARRALEEREGDVAAAREEAERASRAARAAEARLAAADEARTRADGADALEDRLRAATAERDERAAEAAALRERLATAAAEVEALRASLAAARGAVAEAELRGAVAGPRRSATPPTPLHDAADDVLLDAPFDDDDRTLRSAEVRRERTIVLALLFLAVATGVALATGGFAHVLH